MSSPSCRADLGPRIGPLALILLSLCACVRGRDVLPDGAGAAEALAAQAQTFLAYRVRQYPVWASERRLDGENRNELDDASKETRTKELAWLEAFIEGLPKAVARERLSLEGQAEYDVLRNRAERDAFELKELRPFERDPGAWLTLASDSISSLALREELPLTDRMRAVTARLEKWPSLFTQAKTSLGKPPRLWTELALERSGGLAESLRKGLPEIFAPVEDPALHTAFQDAQGKAFDALIAYAFFLRQELLPVSRGNLGLGEAGFSRWLTLETGATESLDALSTWSQDELVRAQTAFVDSARRLDADHPAPEVLAKLLALHPENAELVNEAQETLDALFAFMGTKNLVSPPPGERARVLEAPPLLGPRGFAHLEGPSLFLTFPEPGWSPPKIAAQLRFFARASLPHVLAREGYPGRYTQRLFGATQASPTLRHLGPDALPESWALYSEQLIADEGFAKEGPGREAIRLVQTSRHLVALARFRALLSIHLKSVPLPEVIEQFRKDALVSLEDAQREVRRTTFEPKVATDVLGQRELGRLRKEAQAREGQRFSLKGFHDRVLKTGRPTWPALRLLLSERR